MTTNEKRTSQELIERHSSDNGTALGTQTENPLAKYSTEELTKFADTFAKDTGLEHISDDIRKGAFLGQNPSAWETMNIGLTEDEREALRDEVEHKWKQPRTLYYLVILCSVAAAVQGMDETVVNGAQLFYVDQFGIDESTQHGSIIVGLVNSAPYLCCAVLGCWLTKPLNHFLGRRGTIFVTAFLSFAACIWQAVTNSWPHLFVARFVLGLGIGPKSATVPVYSAECAPAKIRGALVMQWQVWTAFGIMLGFICDLGFYYVPDSSGITGLSWRLMLGSAGVPALLLLAQVFFCPESPRWLIGKGRHAQAYDSLVRLRNHKILAARDLFMISVALEEERKLRQGRFLFGELFTVPRNRRAALASTIVMFGQQFCGVNAIAYYSSTIFSNAGFSTPSALAASIGFGALNWIFALPGFFTIDRFGRRSLLLVTFPLMAIFLFMTGLAFLIPGETSDARVAVVALGVYLYVMCYSPGEGPVPFTYSAEVYPLYIRELGMSFATAVLWGFNFVVAITFPLLLNSFGNIGAFCWYAGWCVALWVLILLFVPETKGVTLEELDEVFSVPTRVHARYGLRQLPFAFRRYVLRDKSVQPEQIYSFDIEEAKNRQVDPEKQVVAA